MRLIMFVCCGFLINCSLLPKDSPTSTYSYVVEKSLRNVSEQKSTAEQAKVIAVLECKGQQPCSLQDAIAQKKIPYTEFSKKIQSRIAKHHDVMERQLHLLASELAKLKTYKLELEDEQKFYKHDLKYNRMSSMRNVVQVEKRAQVELQQEQEIVEQKISKIETDLNFLKKPAQLQLGMDDMTEKVMELVEFRQDLWQQHLALAGQLAF